MIKCLTCGFKNAISHVEVNMHQKAPRYYLKNFLKFDRDNLACKGEPKLTFGRAGGAMYLNIVAVVMSGVENIRHIRLLYHPKKPLIALKPTSEQSRSTYKVTRWWKKDGTITGGNSIRPGVFLRFLGVDNPECVVVPVLWNASEKAFFAALPHQKNINLSKLRIGDGFVEFIQSNVHFPQKCVISLGGSGYHLMKKIYFNVNACPFLADIKYFELFYNPKLNVMGLQIVDDETRNSHPIRLQRDKDKRDIGKRIINAGAFFSYFDIRLPHRIQVEPEYDEKNRTIFLPLSKGVRSGRRKPQNET